MYRRSFRSGLLAAAAGSILATGAWAQAEGAEPVELDEVIVTGAPLGATQRAMVMATDVVDAEELAVAPASSLGDLLGGRPGVRSTAFAPGASRPVIRGLSGPRVQVLTNGMGLIDASSVSPDHQVAADPAEANRIEIIRGPATLMYGGSAIGGVVNVLDGRIPTALPIGGLEGTVSAQASSVDDGHSGFARLTAGQGRFAFNIDGASRSADDYGLPDSGGRQANSHSELEAWGLGGSFIADRGFVGASFKQTDSEYGAVADETVFIRLRQQRVDVRGEYEPGAGPVETLRASFGQADYAHTEFEDVDEPGTVFRSDGWEARGDLVLRSRGGWHAVVGAQGLARDFEAVGEEAFVPSTRVEEGGLYAVQRYDRGALGFEGGVRFDRRDLTAATDAGSVERRFDAWSASAASFYRPAPGLFVGLSLSRTERAPSDIELFADGPHIATGAYEVGDADLGLESVVTLEATAHYDRGRFSGDLHLYRAAYDGFIDSRPTGADAVDPHSGEALPVFRYVQTGADFRGFEVEAAWALWEDGDRELRLEGALDHVDASTDLGPAARIPPWSATARLAWASKRHDAALEVRRVARQDEVAAFETPTDGYTMVNLSGAWRPFADRNVTVFAEVHNLTDVTAREHASFLKDIAPQPGRNLRLGVAYRF